MPLVMGVVFGTIITVILVITAICIFWKSCRSYKKRRSDGGNRNTRQTCGFQPLWQSYGCTKIDSLISYE